MKNLLQCRFHLLIIGLRLCFIQLFIGCSFSIGYCDYLKLCLYFTLKKYSYTFSLFILLKIGFSMKIILFILSSFKIVLRSEVLLLSLVQHKQNRLQFLECVQNWQLIILIAAVSCLFD